MLKINFAKPNNYEINFVAILEDVLLNKASKLGKSNFEKDKEIYLSILNDSKKELDDTSQDA